MSSSDTEKATFSPRFSHSLRHTLSALDFSGLRQFTFLAAVTVERQRAKILKEDFILLLCVRNELEDCCSFEIVILSGSEKDAGGTQNVRSFFFEDALVSKSYSENDDMDQRHLDLTGFSSG